MGNNRSAAVWINRGPNCGRHIKTQFTYKKYHQYTECPGYPGVPQWWIQAERWDGGIWEGDDKSHWDTLQQKKAADAKGNAVSHPRNSGFYRSTGKGYTCTAEIVVMGVGLRARSGYSTYVDMTWNFGGAINDHWRFYPHSPPTISPSIFSY